MFGKRRFNSFFGDLDSMFNDLNSVFNDNSYFVTGKRNVESGVDDSGEWTKESFTSDDGTYKVTTIIRNNTKGVTPQKSNSKINTLKINLEKAVEEQEFEMAAKLRDQIKSMEVNQNKIEELNTKLNDAVSNQDFEEAIKLRDQIKKLEN